MVCAVEKKLRAAGYRAELADNQPVVIDGVMIENVVLLELRRVVR